MADAATAVQVAAWVKEVSMQSLGMVDGPQPGWDPCRAQAAQVEFYEQKC